MSGGSRARLAGPIAGVLVLVGCISPSGGPGQRNDAAERPDASAEYDVLVAQQYEHDGRFAEALEAYQRAVAKDDESSFLHRKVAESLLRTQRVDEALLHAQRALELDPDDAEARRFLGQIYRLRRNVGSAEELLLDESGQAPDADAAFLLYQLYIEARRFEDARRMAEQLVEAEPYAIRGRLALAIALERLERGLEAEQVLREALEVAPGNLQIYGAIAQSLRARSDREAEIALYLELLEEHPHHHGTLVALGEAQMALEDVGAAVATFEEVERYYPNDLRSIVRLGFLKYELRDFSGAAERFERTLEVSPSEHEIAFFLGLALRRSGDDEGALDAFERIPVEHKNYADARTQAAAIYERRGEFGSALAEVERATQVNPSRPLDLYAAALRAKSGDLEGAVSQLESMLEGEPQDDELLYNLGVVYGEAKRVDEAIHYMQLALKHNPDNANALNYIGYSWAETGTNLDEAEQLIVRALELRPDDGYIIDSLGWVYYMRALSLIEAGRTDEAQSFIDRALAELRRADELTGGDPVISEHLGDTYLLLNEKDLALDKFEEAIRLEPRQGEQPRLLEKFETLRRELR